MDRKAYLVHEAAVVDLLPEVKHCHASVYMSMIASASWRNGLSNHMDPPMSVTSKRPTKSTTLRC